MLTIKSQNLFVAIIIETNVVPVANQNMWNERLLGVLK